jgi:hypothetical protein
MKSIILALFAIALYSSGCVEPSAVAAKDTTDTTDKPIDTIIPGVSIDSLYLGKTAPGETPVEFLAGITERICISSDGKTIFFNTSNGSGNYVAQGLSCYRYTAKSWGAPEALFEHVGEASLSVNDSVLYLQNDGSNSFYSMKNDTGWSEPVVLWSNNSTIKHHLQVTNSGAFYVTTTATSSKRGDISKVIIDGTDISFQSLPSPINSTLNGVDFYMGKDESYIIFPQISTRYGSPEGGDLFICFRKSDSSWTDPIDLGARINTSDWEYGPYVSPDKNYLFFSRDLAKATFWVKIDDLINRVKIANGI